MKDLPSRVVASGGSSAGGNSLAGGMKDVGVLGMPVGKSGAKKGGLDKENGGKSLEAWHQDPNTKLIPPA